MLPPFEFPAGRLPDGEHEADWQEVVDRFGWNPRRRQLLDGLADAIELLAAAGRRRLWLNGSFVTAKEEPADFDACWDTDGVDLDVWTRSCSTSRMPEPRTSGGLVASCSRTSSSQAPG